MENEILENEEKEAKDLSSEEEEAIAKNEASGEEIAKNEENQTEISNMSSSEVFIDNEAECEKNPTLHGQIAINSIKNQSGSDEISALKAQLEEERRKRIESENKMACMAILEEKGLPRSLCELLAASSEEETRKRADQVAEIIKKAVNDEVSKRLSSLPKPQKSKNVLTKNAFKGMSLDEMQRLYKSDKSLYLELAKKQ